jgi:hypothetical protein
LLYWHNFDFQTSYDVLRQNICLAYSQQILFDDFKQSPVYD